VGVREQVKGKGIGKVHLITCPEGPEGEKIYSSTVLLTSALDEGWAVNAKPQPLYQITTLIK
jgi:hypothetical protein